MKPALKRAAAVVRRRPPATEPPAEGGAKKIKERLRLALVKLRARRVPWPSPESSSIPEGSLVDTAPVGHIDVSSLLTSVEGDPISGSARSPSKTENYPGECRCQNSETHRSALEDCSVVSSDTTVTLPTPSLLPVALPPVSNSSFLTGVQNARVGTLEVATAGRDTVRNIQFIFNGPIISFGGTCRERGKVGDLGVPGLVSFRRNDATKSAD
ncbi:hypothetical protein NMY22_g552 [Coprinellus aureogranulatus]|nr:hypothetical protein NMY22_g552 [Coprinellus aureogranulatus]